MPDYASMYDEYWSRPDRWQSHSFIDADSIVDQILKLGGGRMLDVGCGMCLLVLTLRERGIDARGLDVAMPEIIPQKKGGATPNHGRRRYRSVDRATHPESYSSAASRCRICFSVGVGGKSLKNSNALVTNGKSCRV